MTFALPEKPINNFSDSREIFLPWLALPLRNKGHQFIRFTFKVDLKIVFYCAEIRTHDLGTGYDLAYDHRPPFSDPLGLYK